MRIQRSEGLGSRLNPRMRDDVVNFELLFSGVVEFSWVTFALHGNECSLRLRMWRKLIPEGKFDH